MNKYYKELCDIQNQISELDNTFYDVIDSNDFELSQKLLDTIFKLNNISLSMFTVMNNIDNEINIEGTPSIKDSKVDNNYGWIFIDKECCDKYHIPKQYIGKYASLVKEHITYVDNNEQTIESLAIDPTDEFQGKSSNEIWECVNEQDIIYQDNICKVYLYG